MSFIFSPTVLMMGSTSVASDYQGTMGSGPLNNPLRRRGMRTSAHVGFLFQDHREPDDPQDRGHRRRDHVPHDGLHHLRQPGDPLRRRRRSGCGVRRHVPRRGDRHPDHGALCQLPHRPRPGHGPQRLFHLRRGPRHGPCVAGGARRRLRLRHPIHHPERAAGQGMDRQFDSALAQNGHIGRHRPVPRHHRAQERRHRRRSPGDPGHPRRPHGARAPARRCRLPRHGGAQRPSHPGRPDHRDPRGDRRRHRARRLRAWGRGLDAAQPGADVPPDGHRRSPRDRARHHHLRLPVRRLVRHRRYSRPGSLTEPACWTSRATCRA